MKREPRLQFSDADLAEPKLEKPIKRVKKAEVKADKAQAKIPKKTVAKKELGFNPATGKVKTQLRFEEVDKKKPPSKLTHAVQDAPANLILSQVHREIAQSEDDNVGVEAAHKMEEAVERPGGGARRAAPAPPTAPISSNRIAPPSVRRKSWSEPILTRSRRKQRSTAPPAIPFPSGSRSRPLKSSMPLPSTIRQRRLRQRRQRIPPRPRKKPLKRLRKLANMCGSTGAALPLPPRFC